MNTEELRESFEDFVEKIKDYRIDRNKRHSVAEILFLTLIAIICGAEGWRDIERFGKAKIDLLRSVFPYDRGIPSDDTLRRFYRCIDPSIFKEWFAFWAKDLKTNTNKHLSIDGKVSRHTFDIDGNPLHMVSVFASDCRMVLAQEKVADKSNEITAIPKLLELIDIKDSTVTIDAMGCQREIAQIICDKEADYVLSLKGNQGTLHEDVKLLFNDEKLLKTLNVDINHTTDGSEHGRIEERTYRSIEIPKELSDQHKWPKLETVVEVISERTVKEISTKEKRYYITSLKNNAKEIGEAIRSHWSVENSLHWILDISFRDDESRIRRGNAPQNIAIIKHMALNLLQKTKKKRDSIKQLRKAAGWSDAQLFEILGNI